MIVLLLCPDRIRTWYTQTGFTSLAFVCGVTLSPSEVMPIYVPDLVNLAVYILFSREHRWVWIASNTLQVYCTFSYDRLLETPKALRRNAVSCCALSMNTNIRIMSFASHGSCMSTLYRTYSHTFFFKTNPLKLNLAAAKKNTPTRQVIPANSFACKNFP